MSEWQPIETAPKDRRIMLALPKQKYGEKRVVFGIWNQDEYARKPRPYFSYDQSVSMGMVWTRDTQPIAWQEVPEPPK